MIQWKKDMVKKKWYDFEVRAEFESCHVICRLGG